MLIRGIADYKVRAEYSNSQTEELFFLQDGTRRKEWQHYAALMAASVLKSVVEKIEPVG